MRGTAQSDPGSLAAPISPVLWGFSDTLWRDGLLAEREQTKKKGWVGEGLPIIRLTLSSRAGPGLWSFCSVVKKGY